MNSELILFFVLAVAAVATAVAMLLNRNAVYAALFLILNFTAVAVLYLFLGAPFIAMAQVTVYAGAIMVLFLFVIMLLGAEKLTTPESVPWQRPLSIVLAGILFVEGVYLVIFRGAGSPILEPPPSGYATPTQIGLLLFNEYLLPFEITSVILLVAVIGAIVLTKTEKTRAERLREEALAERGKK